MENSVEIKNQQLTLASIQEDTRSAAQKLSETYAEHEEAKTALASTHAEKSALEGKMTEDSKEMADKHLALDQRHNEMASREKHHKDEVAIAQEQKAAALKELSRLNDWIATADKEYAEKQERNRQLDLKLIEEANIEAAIVKIKQAYADEELHFDVLKKTRSQEVADLEAKALAHTETCRVAEERTAQAEIRANEAVNERQKAIDDKDRICADLAIYVARVEAKFGEAFPDLHMIL